MKPLSRSEYKDASSLHQSRDSHYKDKKNQQW